MTDRTAELRFGSADVCSAAGIKGPTLDAWLLRGHYLGLPPVPGVRTGRKRWFTAAEAITIAIAADLAKAQLSITASAKMLAYLTRRTDWMPVETSDIWWLLSSRSATGNSVWFSLQPAIDASAFAAAITQSATSVVVCINVSQIAHRTLARLDALMAAAPSAGATTSARGRRRTSRQVTQAQSMDCP